MTGAEIVSRRAIAPPRARPADVTEPAVADLDVGDFVGVDALEERCEQQASWRAVADTLHCKYIAIVADAVFQWDERKARINLAKHGVSFDEAATVFGDEFAIIISDPDHSSQDEDRFLLLGMSRTSRALVVCHCFRGASEDADAVDDMDEGSEDGRATNDVETGRSDEGGRNGDPGVVIRIISARKATTLERRTYEGKRDAR